MKRYIIYTVLLTVLAGCTVQSGLEKESDLQAASPLMTKAVNSSEGASDDVLLLYMESGAADEVFNQMGVKSHSRVFPVVPAREELAAKYNLDRWYVVELEEGSDLKVEAARIAEFPQVKRLQFNTGFSPRMKVSGFAQPVTRSAAEEAGYIFNDPMAINQWHYINVGDKSKHSTALAGADINVKDAWRLTAGDPRVVVAVLDEGVKHSHPDLAANMYVNEKELNGTPGVDDDNNGYIDDVYGYNFVADTAKITWAEDSDTGHGTHVAGTVAAVNNNGLGVCGVAGGTGNGDGVRIMSCQIMSGTEGGGTLYVARAVKYAADNGASIIQGSFGYYYNDAILSDGAYESEYSIEADAFKYFIETAHGCDALKGGVVIMAAGNEQSPKASYPSAHRDIVSVTATAIDGLPAYYTNHGPGSNVAAPGGEATSSNRTSAVLSTFPSELGADYSYMQGSSMACPHVSGVAALGLSYALKLGKSYTPEEFRTLLCTSTNDIDSYLEGEKVVGNFTLNLDSYYGTMGSGTIDAWKLLMAIDGLPSIQVSVTDSPYMVSLDPYFGGNSQYLTYLSITCDQATKDALGLEVAEISYGKLRIHATKAGSGIFTIKALSGGDVEGGENTTGGTLITKKVSIISRNQKVSSNGGWL